MSSSNNNSNEIEDLEAGIASIEESLTKLKLRYQQVKRDQTRQKQLKELASDLKNQAQTSEERKAIASELKHIEKELVNLEINLESRLWNWKELQKPFWQIVRFTGVGILIGWILKTLSQ